METYLVGVVSAEMGRRSPASRRRSARRRSSPGPSRCGTCGRWDAQGFDLYASVADQVYGGAASETPEGRAAVEATRGRILTYGGAPIDAFFYSTCGGRTADGTEVFRAADRPYLRSVPDVGRRRHGLLQHLAALPLARGVDRRGAPRHAAAHPAGARRRRLGRRRTT